MGKLEGKIALITLALSLSGCVSTKSLDQSFGAGQGRRIINSEIAFLISGRASAEPASRL
jgi:hypothetical protein